MSRAKVFKDAYEKRVWGKAVRSGEGSRPVFAMPYVEYVRKYLEVHPEVRGICDIGHGDWSMWKHWRFPAHTYVGVDVAPGLSEYVTDRFGSETHRFIELDAVEDDIPDADLCLVKDVVIHLSDADILLLVDKLKKYSKVIVCSDIRTFGVRANLGNLYRSILAILLRRGRRLCDDIQTGGYHFVNIADKRYRLEENGFRIADQVDFIVTGDVFGRSTLKRIWALQSEVEPSSELRG